MRIAQLGGLTLRLSGGTDGKGGGHGPVVVLVTGSARRGTILCTSRHLGHTNWDEIRLS